MPNAPFLHRSFFLYHTISAIFFMTSYFTIDNNKFGPYRDYPLGVRNYIVNNEPLMYSFLRTKTSKTVVGARESAAREPPFIELVSFLVLEDM